MDNSVWLVFLGLVMLWWVTSRKRLAEEAVDVLQLPARRRDDRPMTVLDDLVLEVARHDVLARWHGDGRQLLLDSPVYDLNVEGGWDVISRDFGSEIGERYEQLFLTFCAMPKKKRLAVLSAAKAKSQVARQWFRNADIRHPDGTVHKLPSWMVYS